MCPCNIYLTLATSLTQPLREQIWNYTTGPKYWQFNAPGNQDGHKLRLFMSFNSQWTTWAIIFKTKIFKKKKTSRSKSFSCLSKLLIWFPLSSIFILFYLFITTVNVNFFFQFPPLERKLAFNFSFFIPFQLAFRHFCRFIFVAQFYFIIFFFYFIWRTHWQFND